MTDDGATRTVVVAYRGIPHARGWATGDNLVRAFRRLGHEVHAYGSYHGGVERLETEALPARADLLVYCECNDEEAPYDELRSYPAGVRAYWDFDVDNGRQAVCKRLIRRQRFDVIFHANRRYGAFFEPLAGRVVFLPYAFDDEHFLPLDRPRTVDVGLIGSPYPERTAYLAELAALGAHVQLAHGLRQGGLVEAINALKIHLNLNIDSRGGGGLLVGRVWETLGCGRLLLTERKDFVETLFADGTHVVLFDDVADCADKIRRLLEQPDERERIARRGYEYALEHHTYLARARTILAETSELTPQRRSLLRRGLETIRVG